MNSGFTVLDAIVLVAYLAGTTASRTVNPEFM
jgi:hypothetical protein